MMTTEHGMSWVVVLAVLLLALAGALRWDLLRLWWRELLKASPPPPAITPPPLERMLPDPPHHPPHHLHTAETTRPAQHSKPAFHRSGRRG